ncbi:hypothetical protein J1N35_034743 [Gossypium stocksii]|uniref:Uncharacterized protein n=1 Tax=Gossypium stocksii TaxID=47602 RepID=A0A9D3ZQF2_9ROSI|nr:hypothetical protein J1N35_034743 [Gossypium stocksii]
MNGPFIPQKKEGELCILKSKKEWNKEDKRNIQLSINVMYTLFCALDLDEYSKVSSYSNAKKDMRHMTGNKSHFVELKPKSGGEDTFGDNSKGLIEGIDSIGKNSSIFIENVL